MKKSKWKNLRKNKGTALLFALGVLSVLVVVAMMFASKARVESTISSIQRENLSARILAKSLIPRVIIGINKSTRFQDQLLFSSVASGEDADDDDPDAEGGKKWKEIKDDRYDFDWIWKLEDGTNFAFEANSENSDGTKPALPTYSEDKHGNREYDAKTLPNWQYIHEPKGRPANGNSNDSGAVIARFAYITIPTLARLNPNAIANHVYCKHLTTEQNRDLADGCNYCAKRLGNSAAELFFTLNNGGIPYQKEFSAQGDDYELRCFLSFNAEDYNSIFLPLASYQQETKGKIVPFAKDSADNYYCMHVETGEIYYNDNDDGLYYKIFASFADMIAVLRK